MGRGSFLAVAIQGLYVLLQTAVATGAEWITPIVNLGGFGVVSYLLYLVLTKAGPSALNDFRESLSQQRGAAIEALHQSRTDFIAALREQRDAYERLASEQQKQFLSALADERKAYRELVDSIWRHEVPRE